MLWKRQNWLVGEKEVVVHYGEEDTETGVGASCVIVESILQCQG